MTSKLNRLMCSIGFALAIGIGGLPQTATALETPNVLMNVDGMTLMHSGLFRNNTPNDGFGTFEFGPGIQAVGSLNRYKSFYFVKTAVGDCCRSHNARIHTDSPEIWTGAGTTFAPFSSQEIVLDSDVFPIIDRATGGQVFDPAEYQIEVKFRPNLGVAGLPNNAAPLFTIGLDQHDGMVWDAQVGRYKRGNEQHIYDIGSAAIPINDWYAAAPKDADGFATFTIPVTAPHFIQRGFYYNFFTGGQVEREAEAITGNGRVFNETTMAWEDANDGLDTLTFGSGPAGPGSTPLKTPQGVSLIAFGAPNAEAGLSVEVKYAALTRINRGRIVARIDENSGISYRFGSALTYGETQPDIVVDGIPVRPNATNQISRFDQNGMTNLVINAREPNAGEGPFRGYQYRFMVRTAPGAETFDGSNPNVMMNIRAKLLPTNTATSMTIFAKDLDGSDCSAVNINAGCRAIETKGADEYTHALDLSQFNTSDFVTISVPLNAFTLATFVPPTTTNPTDPLSKDSLGPFGWSHAGDGLRTDFNLYEFGAGVVAGAGLLRMEIDYMELLLPATNIPGDHNLDGTVDAADYVAWRKNPSAFGGDPAGYNTWKQNFGESLGSGGGAVPEPAAWLLLSFAAAFIGFGRQRGN